MKHFKVHKLDLLYVLYYIEDKFQYKSKSLSLYIDKLQKQFKQK